MKKDPYEKLLGRKRKWTPVQTTAGKLKEGAEETIFRALAIRHMELPVGSWVTEALGKDVPNSARVLLESNVKDEENHDLALGYIANSFGLTLPLSMKRSDSERHGNHTPTTPY